MIQSNTRTLIRWNLVNLADRHARSRKMTDVEEWLDPNTLVLQSFVDSHR